MYNGPRHVVVIGSRQNSRLLPRCEANFKWVLPELWFSPSSWLKSQTQRTVVQCQAINPGKTPNRNFCLMHFQMNSWQDNAACIRWKQYGTTLPVCVSWNPCFPVGYACACSCTISLCASKHIVSLPLQLSECQAPFNTWISRSPPHAHLLLHTPLISIPL